LSVKPPDYVSKQVRSLVARTDAILVVAVKSITLTTDALGAESAALTMMCTAQLLVTPVTSR